MKIKPMGDRILIKIIKIEQHGSITIPQHVTISGSAGVAEVIGVGQGYLTDKKTDDGVPIWDQLETKLGERIIFNAKAGISLTRDYRLIRESEIVAKVIEDGVDIGDDLWGGDDD